MGPRNNKTLSHLGNSITCPQLKMGTNPLGDARTCVASFNAGCYIVGEDTFYTRSTHFSNILFRQVAGSYDNFLLGILCVLTVAVLSDIVYTVLLRGRGLKSPSLFSIQAGLIFSDITHFRNIFSCGNCFTSKTQEETDHLSLPVLPRRSSFSILLAGLAIFSIEVAFIYASLPLSLIHI